MKMLWESTQIHNLKAMFSNLLFLNQKIFFTYLRSPSLFFLNNILVLDFGPIINHEFANLLQKLYEIHSEL